MSENKTDCVPTWASAPLRAFIDDQDASQELLHLAMRGLAMHEGLPPLMAWVAKDPAYEAGFGKTAQELATRDAEIAKAEVERGFPMLHAQATVSLWASLEVLVRDLVATWLINDPEARRREPLGRMKVRIGEYESLSPEERGEYLVELAEQELQARLKPGVGRFEALLSAVGLNGEVPDGVRRCLLELSQVRNVLVHRRGVADRRFVERCPWLGYDVGATVVVSHAALGRYSTAAMGYGGFILLQRLNVLFCGGPIEALARDIERWSEKVANGQASVAGRITMQ